MSITFLFYIVSMSESRHFVCKCYVSRLVRMSQFKSKGLYCSFGAMGYYVRLRKLHSTYTWQHELLTDTNTVLDIVKATSFYRTVMRYFT